MEHGRNDCRVTWEEHVNYIIDGDGDVVVFIKKGSDFVMCYCIVLKMDLFFLFGEEADEFMEKGQ